MAERMRSRKAIVISLFVHMVLLTIIGWLVGTVFAVHDTPEQYVELELANEVGNQLERGNMNSGSKVPDIVSADKANEQVVNKQLIPSVKVPSGDLALQPIGSGDGIGIGTSGGGEGTIRGNGAGKGTVSGGGNGKGIQHSGGIIDPSILRKVKPDYPENAREAGYEGTVVLKIQVLESGRAGNISVYRSSGFGELDDAAIDAMRKWRFSPARERDSGKPIICYIKLPVVFDLTNQE